MKNTSADAKLSILNVLSIVDNSIKILLDTDELLGKQGWQAVHGNYLGSEHSKNIRQQPTDLGRFLPNYMSRYYYRHKGNSNLVLGVNIQLYHPRHPELEPSIWAALLTLEDSYNKKSPANIYYWLLKNAVFENDHQPNLDGTTATQQGNPGPHITFFGLPLMEIQARDYLQQKIIEPMLKLPEFRGDSTAE